MPLRRAHSHIALAYHTREPTPSWTIRWGYAESKRLPSTSLKSESSRQIGGSPEL